MMEDRKRSGAPGPVQAATRSRSAWLRPAGSVGARRDPPAMAKKQKKWKDKRDHNQSNEERKRVWKHKRFRRAMLEGMAQAETNDHAWQDIVGAIQTIQRIVLIKSQNTLHVIKGLEKQTKYGPKSDELTKEAIQDKLKLANTLIAQGMHWDKIDGALVRAHSLCKNEDETLRGPWAFTDADLAETATGEGA